MDYLNTYKALDEEIVFHSTQGLVLSLCESGRTGGWLKRENGKCIGYGDQSFDFDLLEYFPFIRKEMRGSFLEISFENKRFCVKLGSMERFGGYKESLEEIVFFKTSASSVYQALAKMNNRLKRQVQDIENAPIINFESYKRNLQLLKK